VSCGDANIVFLTITVDGQPFVKYVENAMLSLQHSGVQTLLAMSVLSAFSPPSIQPITCFRGTIPLLDTFESLPLNLAERLAPGTLVSLISERPKLLPPL
jgi:hypothetical protein